jgi:hypothetical protein
VLSGVKWPNVSIFPEKIGPAARHRRDSLAVRTWRPQPQPASVAAIGKRRPVPKSPRRVVSGIGKLLLEDPLPAGIVPAGRALAALAAPNRSPPRSLNRGVMLLRRRVHHLDQGVRPFHNQSVPRVRLSCDGLSAVTARNLCGYSPSPLRSPALGTHLIPAERRFRRPGELSRVCRRAPWVAPGAIREDKMPHAQSHRRGGLTGIPALLLVTETSALSTA